jgi:hypothetical protein
MRNKNKCPYCHGHGLYAGYWDVSLRRPMEKGPFNTPLHKDLKCYQCDRCGEPKKYPPPPLQGSKD